MHIMYILTYVHAHMHLHVYIGTHTKPRKREKNATDSYFQALGPQDPLDSQGKGAKQVSGPILLRLHFSIDRISCIQAGLELTLAEDALELLILLPLPPEYRDK